MSHFYFKRFLSSYPSIHNLKQNGSNKENTSGAHTFIYIYVENIAPV